MKQLCYILVLYSFLLLNFSGALRLVSFNIFQPYFTSEFCINQDKPLMKCEGKCYLKKMMKEEEKQKKGIPDFQKLDLFFESTTVAVSESNTLYLTNIPTPYLLPRGISLLEHHSPPPQSV